MSFDPTIRSPRTKHGLCKSPEYRIWSGMRRRCNNRRDKSFRNYGGRGIKVCERWGDFRLFLADMGFRPSSLHSIDRINNDGDYEPKNCRWASEEVQRSNTSRNKYLTRDGRTQTIRQWATELGLSKSTLRTRLQSGMSVIEALSRTHDYRRQQYCRQGHILTEDNVYHRPNGKRECRICRTATRNRYKTGAG